MSILVTGGAGFIGSNMVDVLIEEEKEVIIVDNLSTGYKENINEKAIFYNIDLTDRKLFDVFDNHDIEKVIHLGAQIDVTRSVNDPIYDSHVNIQGSINLFQACVKHETKKVVYASSAAVYGEPNYLPINEKHRVKAMSPYGVSKHTPEHYLKYFNKEYGLDYTVLRYSNAYGPRQSAAGEGGVIAIFIDRMLDSKRPVIYGDGEQTRDFIHVYDVIQANLKAMDTDTASRKTLNVSTRSETTVNKLVKLINEELDKQIEPIYKERKKGDIRHSILDNSKALDYLDWEPQYEIEEGIKQTVKYYLQRGQNNG